MALARKAFLSLAVLYCMLFVSLTYWQVFADLDTHPANPRYYQIFEKDRGVIYDRKGIPLAWSELDGASYTRIYAAAGLSPTLGYFHPRYGLTGLERLYHEDLNLGRSLITTLDLDLQKTAAQLLGDQVGAVVVMRPSTGEILALVSSPAVDGNLLGANWSDYLNDERSPFLNRVTHGLYPPGSTVKPIVYGTALLTGLTESSTLWEDQGSLLIQNRSISNFGNKAHGSIPTDRALALSSNVVFAQLAVSLGDRLLEAYRSFGLGSSLVFDLENQGGHCPVTIASDYDAAQLGIGQGKLLVTPLQMACLVSTIANDGVMMRPFVVWELRGGLRMRQIIRPQSMNSVWEASLAQEIQKAMVLAAREGTAKTNTDLDLDYGGKTGTAQMALGRDHAWFIGFAPAAKPEVTVAVLMEHGGTGSQVAVPLGTKLLKAALGLDE
ncbi:MAG: hypothetical protein GX249_04880 [Firmicutes bacterium]|nr:hypothetical protein [Bacillota bacterium]